MEKVLSFTGPALDFRPEAIAQGADVRNLAWYLLIGPGLEKRFRYGDSLTREEYEALTEDAKRAINNDEDGLIKRGVCVWVDLAAKPEKPEAAKEIGT